MPDRIDIPRNPVPVEGYANEADRMARETARDAWRMAYAMAITGQAGTRRFSVQHTGGQLTLAVEHRPNTPAADKQLADEMQRSAWLRAYAIAIIDDAEAFHAKDRDE